MMVAVLRVSKSTIRAAATCKAALDAFLEEPPDLILCDVNLPDGNGYDLCRDLREQGATMPIILTSGWIDEDRATDCGATSFLAKPFERWQLSDAVFGALDPRYRAQGVSTRAAGPSAAELEERLAAAVADARRRFLKTLPRLADDLERLAAESETSEDAVGQIFKRVHALAGTAGCCGFSELSEIARNLEFALESSGGSNPRMHSLLSALIARLRVGDTE